MSVELRAMLKGLIRRVGGGGGSEGWPQESGRLDISVRTEDFLRNRLRIFANCHKAENNIEITSEISHEVP